MSDSVVAAILRFVSMFLGLAAAVAIVVYVPDPNLKIVGGGLAVAIVGAIEEFYKTRAAL